MPALLKGAMPTTSRSAITPSSSSSISGRSTPNRTRYSSTRESSWVRPTRAPCWIHCRRRLTGTSRASGPFLNKTMRGTAMLGEERSRCRCAFGRYDAIGLGPPEIFLHYIPKGHAGTRKTVQAMQGLIREGAKNFYLRQKAIDILLSRNIRPKDYLGEIKALFDWVQQNIRYTKDPFRLEVLHSARRMLQLRAGDCDDMAILLGAMVESVGHPVRLVLTGPDPLRPDLFTHVYLEAFHKGQWIPLDPTMPHPAGWAPRALVKTVIAIERRPDVMDADMELQGLDSFGQVPGLRGLIRAVRGGA